MKRKKLYLIISALIFILGIGSIVNHFWPSREVSKSDQKVEEISSDTNPLEQEPKNVPESEAEDQSPIPSSFQIENVPFQPQAPNAFWDQLHDEACEEASLVIAKYYLDGKSLSAETMDQEILKMVDWEVQNWGSHKDLTAQETAQLGKDFYGLDGLKVERISSLDDIKKEISQNHPIIVPAAGRLLGNPYYRQPGPVYHMLVVTGYDQNRIITNDVGTKRGENFEYADNIFYNAIHDWAGTSDNIDDGQKTMIVVQN